MSPYAPPHERSPPLPPPPPLFPLPPPYTAKGQRAGRAGRPPPSAPLLTAPTRAEKSHARSITLSISSPHPPPPPCSYVLKASVLDAAGFGGQDKYLVGQYDRDEGFSTAADYKGEAHAYGPIAFSLPVGVK